MYKKKLIKLQVCIKRLRNKNHNNYVFKNVNVSKTKTITNYRLHVTGIKQNKQKYFIFFVVY